MKKKYIVELDEDTINECKVLFGQGYANNAEYAISQGIPYNPSGDLISREALKKEVYGLFCPDGYKLDFIRHIDNAPTVEITEEQAIDKLHETGWLIEHDKEMTTRPQGEWLFKHNSSDIWCSVCDENFNEIPQAFNFCPNCGAEMRGGAE